MILLQSLKPYQCSQLTSLYLSTILLQFLTLSVLPVHFSACINNTATVSTAISVYFSDTATVSKTTSYTEVRLQSLKPSLYISTILLQSRKLSVHRVHFSVYFNDTATVSKTISVYFNGTATVSKIVSVYLNYTATVSKTISVYFNDTATVSKTVSVYFNDNATVSNTTTASSSFLCIFQRYSYSL